MTDGTGLRAGVARRVISPPGGIYLIGYGDRTKGNLGIHDELTATALVLEQGRTRLALVALDMLTINEYIVDRIRDCLASLEILLCCSHTHSGPIAYADARSPRKDRAVIDSLVGNIVAAVQQAAETVVPVHLEYASGQADIAINRRERLPSGRMEIGRNPAGVVDRSVQAVSILDERQNRLATLVNYACHGTVLGPDNLLVSADWIGAMRRRVEAELGGKVLFLQGAAANLNPDMYWEDARAFEMVEEQGERVAQAVLQIVRSGSGRLSCLPIGIERREVWLPTEAPVRGARPPKNYGKPLLALAKLPGWLAFLADPMLDRRYPWKPRIEARAGFWSVPMRVSALRLGELALVTFAAETFTEIGLAVKEASPAKHTLFTSLTDGCISYLHTASSHPEGGYEVDVAPLAYRYPGRLQAGGEMAAREAARSALAALFLE